MGQNKNGIYRILLLVNLYFNAVFSLLCPPLLLGFLGRYLCAVYGWNRIVTALLVLIGVAVGFYSSVSYLRKSEVLTSARSEREARSPYRIEHPADKQDSASDKENKT